MGFSVTEPLQCKKKKKKDKKAGTEYWLSSTKAKWPYQDVVRDHKCLLPTLVEVTMLFVTSQRACVFQKRERKKKKQCKQKKPKTDFGHSLGAAAIKHCTV